MKIQVFAEKDRQFWADMGPFFGMRKYRTEMPYLIDEPDDVWHLAMEGKRVIGFIAINPKQVHGLYVVEDKRKNGVGKRLIDSAIANTNTTFAACSPDSITVFRKCGFKEVSKRGKYTKMQYTRKPDKSTGDGTAKRKS